MANTQKRIAGPDENGRITIDAEYLQRLRAECKARRIHEKQLEAEIAQLRGEAPDNMEQAP